ncbi:MAG: hypothetical protein AB1894_16800 [Chloroflexota bacterium]
MNKYWSLREEIYKATHQWTIIIIFLGLGCLLGWLSAYIWPSYYRAAVNIYIGLNPYRAFSDANFLAVALPKYSNIDDYKNWQMSQLEAAIFLDEILQATLEKLQGQDPYWQDKDVQALASMLEAEWRSAGTWSLIARDPDELHAAQAADAWSDVAIHRVQEAIISARNTFMIDQEMQALANEAAKASARQHSLSFSQAELLEWQKNTSQSSSNEPLSPFERWRVLSLGESLAQFTPLWQDILRDQPEPDAPASTYSPWVDRVTGLMQTEIDSLPIQAAELEDQRQQLKQEYFLQADHSLGLSATLTVEGLQALEPERVRPTGLLTILGGVIGLLIWLLSRLVIITAKIQSRE